MIDETDDKIIECTKLAMAMMVFLKEHVSPSSDEADIPLKLSIIAGTIKSAIVDGMGLSEEDYIELANDGHDLFKLLRGANECD